MQVCALGQPHRNWAEWALVSPCFTHAHPLQRGNKVCGVSGSKRLLINNTTDAGTWITFKLFWYATHNAYLCCCWCCCCLMYRFYHNIIGNHTNMCGVCHGSRVSWVVSRSVTCHECLSVTNIWCLGDNTWPWPETTGPILSHCSHPQPCSAASRYCIQITSEKSHLIENNKSLITIREILSPERVLRGWCQYCTHLVQVIIAIAPLPPDNSSQTWWRLLSSWSPDTSSGSKDGASHFLVEEQLPGLDSRDLCYQLRRASWMFCKNCM